MYQDFVMIYISSSQLQLSYSLSQLVPILEQSMYVCTPQVFFPFSIDLWVHNFEII